MKRIILDHYRRWWWVLLACCLQAFWVGRMSVSTLKNGFEFWVMIVTMWTGANLLSFDLKRGSKRVCANLPLTQRQIGIAWWLATVLIPATVLTILLFLGAICSPSNNAIPVRQLFLVSLLIWGWLGTYFVMTFPPPSFLEKGGSKILGVVSSLLATFSLFGSMLICTGATNSLTKFSLLFVPGAILLVVSWFRASEWYFTKGAIGSTTLQIKLFQAKPQAVTDFGGVAFLFHTLYVRMILVWGTCLCFYLIAAWGVKKYMTADSVNAVLNPWFPPLISCLFMILPIDGLFRKLRFLRTLPLSSGRLATMLILLPLPAFITVAILVSSFIAWQSGIQSAVISLKTFAWLFVPISIYIFLAVWQGRRIQGYALLFMILFLLVFTFSLLRQSELFQTLPFGIVASISAASLLVCLALTRFTLRHQSQALKATPENWDVLPWWGR